ncbi:MAG: thioredoxin fold domain-containing protein [Betaproteobacteria bacterium]|jgi:thioredoxin-related protein|nr:thioredoxin fold domain-containing protein [Betaproteobacteria bacterium]
MRVISAVVAALILFATGTATAETSPGKLTGGVVYSLPQWFKPSFFDFPEDIEEARKQDKHVMLFLHLDECPYCARMLRENFASGDNYEFMRKHFDVIGVNVRGNVEVTWIDGTLYTERSLTRHLGAHGTPTIVFLAPDTGKVLQLSGYRNPHALRQALEYVQSKSYRRQPFTAYVALRDEPAGYALRDHPQFSNVSYFKGYEKPLAILFEDRRCGECARFHEKTLNHPDVVAEMKAFLFVRLDTDSNRKIVGLDGKTLTSAQWADALSLTHRPAVVLFNEGREIYRMDSQLYHFHFKEALRYTSGGYYKRYQSVSRYNAARREELLKQGIDIDYSE